MTVGVKNIYILLICTGVAVHEGECAGMFQTPILQEFV